MPSVCVTLRKGGANLKRACPFWRPPCHPAATTAAYKNPTAVVGVGIRRTAPEKISGAAHRRHFSAA